MLLSLQCIGIYAFGSNGPKNPASFMKGWNQNTNPKMRNWAKKRGKNPHSLFQSIELLIDFQAYKELHIAAQ